MENVSINLARDLPASPRSAVENLLGRSLRDDEEVSIMALDPHPAPSGEARRASAERLRCALDTNILARANPHSKDVARTLLLTILESADHVLVLPQFLLGETERVLNYPRLQAIWPLTPLDIEQYTQVL
jgi:hypothetical protein